VLGNRSLEETGRAGLQLTPALLRMAGRPGADSTRPPWLSRDPSAVVQTRLRPAL
jgi:hypothetical protein